MFAWSRSLTKDADISGVLKGSAGTVGTSGADTFVATQTTYTTDDVLVGGDGADVLTINATAAVGRASSVVGIETVNVNTTGMFSAASFDAGGVVGTGTTINVSTVQAGGDGSFAITNLGTGAVVAAATNVTGTLAVTTSAAAAQEVTLSANKATTQTLTLHGTTGTTDAATVTAAGTVGLVTNGTSQIETVNASGNGAAATYNITGAATTYNLTGSQSVTLGGNVTSFDAKTISDATTAGTTTLKITTAGAANLSKAAVDVVDLNVSDAALAYSVRAGQAIKISDETITEVATWDINDNVADNVTTGAISIDLAGVLTTAKGIALNATKTDDYINALSISNNTVANGTALVTAANAAVTLSGSKDFTLEAASTATSFDATGFSGVFKATANATNKAITGGSGNDEITVATATTVTVNGGAGTDTLKITTDVSGLTASNFEVIALTGGVTVSKASLWNGGTQAVTGASNVNISAMDSSTIDLSGLQFKDATTFAVNSGSAAALDATKYTSTTGLTVIGSNVVDTIVGTANADTITGGNGADVITGGAGADVINLTEATAASDVVLLAVAASKAGDEITGFKVGATSPDLVKVDISELNDIVVNVQLAGKGDDLLAADNAATVTVVSAAYDLGTAAGSDMLTISGDYATAGDLETALETGGARALTVNVAFDAGDAFIVAYDNGADTFLAYVTTTAGALDNAKFAAGDLTVTNFATLKGVTDATTFLTNNVEFIA